MMLIEQITTTRPSTEMESVADFVLDNVGSEIVELSDILPVDKNRERESIQVEKLDEITANIDLQKLYDIAGGNFYGKKGEEGD